jgi:two-component system sensor histidine kinase EvgS
MPLKNGYQLAQDIRAQERAGGRVPCLLLGFTANAQPEEAERCHAAGMDGCLFKPTGLDDLRSALALRAASVAAREPAPMFDLSALIALTGEDHAALNELLRPLLDSLEADHAQLSSLRHKADFSTLHDLAHRAKGGARMVKAPALIASCEALERACEEQDNAALTSAIEDVSQALGELQQALGVYCNQL